MKDEKFSVVIVAGGSGTRLGGEVAKQYQEINGKSILAYAIEKFDQCEIIDDIVVVVPAEDVNLCEDKIIHKYNFIKVKNVVAGGKTRQQSSYEGLKNISQTSQYVMIHDAVRPFISEDCIKRLYQSVLKTGAALLAVPLKDSVVSATADKMVLNVFERSELWSVQTPQAFKTEIIKTAHEQAALDRYEGTDDASLVKRMGLMVNIVIGSYENIKITTREDLKYSQFLLNRRKK